MNQRTTARIEKSGPRDISQWNIGRFTALSILLIGAGAIIGPLFTSIYTTFAIIFAAHFPPFSFPVILYVSCAAVALMLLSAVILFLAHRKSEGEYRTTAF